MVSSLVRYDPLLFESQDNAWRGLVSYYQHGGAEGDPWGGAPSTFRERNTSYVPLAYNQHLKIFETCNFASNIAYYHMNIALARLLLVCLSVLTRVLGTMTGSCRPEWCEVSPRARPPWLWARLSTTGVTPGSGVRRTTS